MVTHFFPLFFCSFSNMLLDHIERDQISSLRRKQQEEEDDVMEEEEDSDDDDDNNDEATETPGGGNEEEEMDPKTLSEEEKDLLRQEFVTSMYWSFLQGKDADFDYT